MKEDQEAINNALFKVGIEIADIYDLVNSGVSYPGAISVLIAALQNGITNDRVKEGVIRALAVKEAKGKANKILIEEFSKVSTNSELLRWAIGNTFDVIITREDVPAILEIVKDRENGMARQMFVLALARVPSDEVEMVLISLLDDEDVIAHAVDALGKMKSKKAKGGIVNLLSHPRPLVRKEAAKALKKIERV